MAEYDVTRKYEEEKQDSQFGFDPRTPQMTARGGHFVGRTDLDGNHGHIDFLNALDRDLGNTPILRQEEEELNFIDRKSSNNSFDEHDERVHEALGRHQQAVEDIQLDFELPEFEEARPDCPQVDLLAQHRQKYARSHKVHERERQSGRWSYARLLKELQERPIDCTKYNHTLEGNVMNHYQFEAKIQISEDGKQLLITNRKPRTNPRYMYEKAPAEVEQEREERNAKARRGLLTQEELAGEQEGQEDGYRWVCSSATCNIADIEGIVYGGRSSRFWIFRKHMISVEYDDLRHDSEKDGKTCAFPFFAWQCITLQISGRSVDLVIKNENDMNVFLRFLVQALNTIDGCVNSAQFYIEASALNEVARREKILNKKILARRKTIRLKEDEEYDDTLRLLQLPQEEKDRILE